MQHAATRELGGNVARGVLEKVVADPADQEKYTTPIFPAYPENLHREPSEEEGTENPHEVNRDHSIEGDRKHEEKRRKGVDDLNEIFNRNHDAVNRRRARPSPSRARPQ